MMSININLLLILSSTPPTTSVRYKKAIFTLASSSLIPTAQKYCSISCKNFSTSLVDIEPLNFSTLRVSFFPISLATVVLTRACNKSKLDLKTSSIFSMSCSFSKPSSLMRPPIISRVSFCSPMGFSRLIAQFSSADNISHK
ncbi:hypothetical protein V6Z12_A05G366500 [Gossypium hirsutum]